MGRMTRGAFVLAVALGIGCGAPTPDTPPASATPGDAGAEVDTSGQVEGLTGTAWRLAEIQSMDDAIGVTRPDDPSLYTMRLQADGTASFRLNCNRATGTWSADPSADPTNGRLEFGPLAVTSALCPPPSLDEELAAQLAYVRGYLLKQGRLYLSLMADAAIIAWDPIEGVPFETVPDPEIEAAILEAEPDYTRDVVDLEGGVGKARYVYGRVDLDADGVEEVFAYLLGSIFCGTGGCNLLLFDDRTTGFTHLQTFPISRLPVLVSERSSDGWRDLYRRESGGGAPASFVRHVFDGTRYVEAERLPAEPEPEGTPVLTGELTFEEGIPLEPRR